MRSLRLLLPLAALVMIFILSGCGSSVVARTAPGMKQASHGKTPTPGIPTIVPGSGAARPMPGVIPIRLVIAAVGINALVEPVGVQPTGDLATPTHHPWDDTGWYDLGPDPGEQGSAVIDGHLDRPGGYPAVFWRLRDVQVGDDVQVKSTAGKVLHFRVTRIAYYTPNQAPLQDIFGNLAGRYLNLITCAGDWIPSQHQTTLRQVVYTTLV